MSDIVDDIMQIQYKNTHHHYIGFYSRNVLSSLHNDNIAIVDGQAFGVSEHDRVVNYHYDGMDVVMGEQRFIYSPSKQLKPKSLVYNSTGQIVSIITKHTDDCKYPISSGFNTTNGHFTNICSLQFNSASTLPINYADKSFAFKEDLIKFLADTPKSQNRGIIIHTSRVSTQVILYENERNVLNLHLRFPLVEHS